MQRLLARDREFRVVPALDSCAVKILFDSFLFIYFTNDRSLLPLATEFYEQRKHHDILFCACLFEHKATEFSMALCSMTLASSRCSRNC